MIVELDRLSHVLSAGRDCGYCCDPKYTNKIHAMTVKVKRTSGTGYLQIAGQW